MLFSKPPSLSHLRVIGCLCYASILPKDDKFSERARLTYCTDRIFCNSTGIFVTNLCLNKFFVNRDVTFQEQLFPFENRKAEYPRSHVDANNDVNEKPVADYDDVTIH